MVRARGGAAWRRRTLCFARGESDNGDEPEFEQPHKCLPTLGVRCRGGAATGNLPESVNITPPRCTRPAPAIRKLGNPLRERRHLRSITATVVCSGILRAGELTLQNQTLYTSCRSSFSGFGDVEGEPPPQ